MIISRIHFLAVTAAFLLPAAGVASAQSATDNGKKKLPKLFAEAVSTATESTVRVQAGTKDVALGTILSADGFILTKGSELRGELSCILRDGSAYDAKYVGYHRLSDLALLKIDADGLKAVKFAEAKAGIIGNWVAATSTTSEPVAVGVISAPARKLYGEQSFIDNTNKGYLGIILADTSDGEGVLVREVSKGTPAAKADIKAKDIIVELAGKSVKGRDSMIEQMEKYRPGDTIDVKIKRGEKEMELKITLGSRADLDKGKPPSELDRSDLQNAMGGPLSGRRTGFPMVIQHDTILKPSECGGPLVDLDGKILGINIARAGRVETWTIPGDIIMPIYKDLKAGKFPLEKSEKKD